jgi:fructose-bisphosphate aldolase class II
LVAWAHERGVAVEAALGAVGGKDGLVTTVEGLTDPGAAAAFVAATGADALAVAVGTTHAMRAQTATIDLDRLERIRRAVAVPLVLHGSSGVPDADLCAAVEAGVVKINLATQLNLAFTAAVRQRLTDTEIVDPRRYLSAGRNAIQALVADRLRLVGAAGRA